MSMQGVAPIFQGGGQKQQTGGNRTSINPKQMYDMAKNFNDQPTGNIVGSQDGTPIMSGPEAGGGALEAGAGAGIEAGGAAAEGVGASLAELAPLALL